MSERIVKSLIAAALMLAIVVPASGQAGEVPRDHWAYDAVQDLVSKGLVKGYPPSGNFFGQRTCTRYEMATIVQRVVARLDEMLAKKAVKDHTHSPTVSQAQVDEIKRLVDEFKVELTVIRTDLDKAKSDIAALQAAVTDLNGKVDAAAKDAAEAKKSAADAKQSVQSAIDAITEQKGRIDTIDKTLKGHKISGYSQLRFEAFDTGRTSLFTPTASGGTGPTPSNGGPVVGGPWYGFLARRVRLKVSGPVGSSGRADYGIQADFPSFTAVNVKEAYADISNLPVKNITFTAGQFAPPFGWELPNSSAVRESPERSLAFSDTTQSEFIFKSSQNAVGGIVTPGSVRPLFLNQEYDQGAMFTYSPHGYTPPGSLGTRVYLMALNGGGTVPAGIRNLKNSVDWILRGQATVLPGLNLGASGYYGELAVRSAPGAAGPPVVVAPFAMGLKELAGVDVNYLTPWKTTLRAEYVGGVYESTPDQSLILRGNHTWAWYVAARHPLTKKLEASIKYDDFMPISQAGVTAGGLGRMALERKTIGGGFLYSFDEAVRLRLWYLKGLSAYDPSAAAGSPLRSHLGFLTGEVQVRF